MPTVRVLRALLLVGDEGAAAVELLRGIDDLGAGIESAPEVLRDAMEAIHEDERRLLIARLRTGGRRSDV